MSSALQGAASGAATGAAAGPWGAAIGGALGLVGGLFGDSSAKKAAKRAAAANERQLKSQHQWEVEDLRKAGLNPILSGTGGGGSGTISTPVAQTGQTGKALSELGQKMLDRQLFNAQIENVQSDTAKKKAETEGINIGNDYLEWDTASKMSADFDFPRKKQIGELQSLVEQIQTQRQGREASAIDIKRNRDRLSKELADPKLQQYLMSQGYAEQKMIDRALDGAATGSDWVSIAKGIAAFIKSLSR